MFSDQYELTTLRALRDGAVGPVTIAKVTGLPQFTARSSLRSLKRRRMVALGGLGHWGEWSITEKGLEELARTEQLRLVR